MVYTCFWNCVFRSLSIAKHKILFEYVHGYLWLYTVHRYKYLIVFGLFKVNGNFGHWNWKCYLTTCVWEYLHFCFNCVNNTDETLHCVMLYLYAGSQCLLYYYLFLFEEQICKLKWVMLELNMTSNNPSGNQWNSSKNVSGQI